MFSVSDEYPDSCMYRGVGPWQFIENRYCHIEVATMGDGSSIFMLSSNTTRFEAYISGFRNMTITNSSTIIISGGNTVRLGT